MATIGCPGGASGCAAGQRAVTGLVEVSHDPVVGQGAEVQGHVVAVAPDGSHVYFVARGALSKAANGQGLTASDGADNLYVYDSDTGDTAFIGDLCSGPATSGAVSDASCPSDLEPGEQPGAHNDDTLWGASQEERLAQAGGVDGGFLVFTTYAQLVTVGSEADADNAQDVYRYDAQTTALNRVSVGENGFDADGNRNDGEAIVSQTEGGTAWRAGDAMIQALGLEVGSVPKASRAVSEDGSRIVFSAAEPLSGSAKNGLVNVYEWHEGAVSLVSCGCSPESDVAAVLTPSGRDLFFATAAGLVPGDTDGAVDVYDARIGGGFAPSPVSPESCEGDACQGPLTNPAPLLVPGSAVQAPGENVVSPTLTVAKSTPKAKRARCRKGYVRKKGRCVKKSKAKRSTRSTHGKGSK